jgi:hypothetical protein
MIDPRKSIYLFISCCDLLAIYHKYTELFITFYRGFLLCFAAHLLWVRLAFRRKIIQCLFIQSESVAFTMSCFSTALLIMTI